MADGGVRFIRKGGRVIPIGAKTAGKVAGRIAKKALPGARIVGAASAVYAIKKNIKKYKANPKQDIKVHKGLDALGLGLSVASGALGAATFSSGLKGFLGGALGSHLIDAGGVTANIASVTGKGKFKQRAEQAARQEARNFLIGNAVYAAGIIGIKRNREKLVEYSGKILEFAKKALVAT